MVVDQYLLAWIFASVIALIAVYGTVATRRSNNNRRASLEEEERSRGCLTVSDAECRSADGDVDVIIVGAGVAGSALAHTLGKVLISLPLFIFSR